MRDIRFPFVAAAAAVVFSGMAGPAAANSADHTGPEVVVPMLGYDKQLDSRVFVENHEERPVPVVVRYIGERSSSTPGLTVCGRLTLPPAMGVTPSITILNPRDPAATGYCRLQGPDDFGMLLVSSTDSSPARLSASGRTDVRDTNSGALAQVLASTGLPLSSLEGSDTSLDGTTGTKVVSGLRLDRTAVKPATSDCFLGALADASGAGGIVGWLSLHDRDGFVLGGGLVLVKPFELVRVRDVFAYVGAAGEVYDEARAQLFLFDGGDSVVAYCWTEERGPYRSTFAVNVAQAVEPRDETARRTMIAKTDTGPPYGKPLTLFQSPISWGRARHALYLRAPDVVTCSVDRTDMTLSATSPVNEVVTGGTTNSVTIDTWSTGEQDRDVWLLTVRLAPGWGFEVPYSISCVSGNGTSLADRFW
jgi:hypothetical protein